MTDVIMTWLLRFVCWSIPLGVLSLIAWVPTAFLAKSRRTAAALFAVLLAAECALCGWLAFHPVVHIPEEYASYITKQEAAAPVRGFYSLNIPVFPCYVEVVRADEREVVVQTWYCFFGTTEHSVTADGFCLTKPLFPHS